MSYNDLRSAADASRATLEAEAAKLRAAFAECHEFQELVDCAMRLPGAAKLGRAAVSKAYASIIDCGSKLTYRQQFAAACATRDCYFDTPLQGDPAIEAEILILYELAQS